MRIRITSRPLGEAPDWVRDAWIGVVLKGAPLDECRAGEVVVGVVSEEVVGPERHTGGFKTGSHEAVGILQESSPAAAEWWFGNFPFLLMPEFVFSASCFEVVDED